MDLVERLQEIQKYSQLSVRALAKECELKQQTLDKQIKGLSEVSSTTILAIASRFPEISGDWILRGVGSMLTQEVSVESDLNAERVLKLVDTIALLQGTINAQSDTIAALNEKIRQLESQLNNR